MRWLSFLMQPVCKMLKSILRTKQVASDYTLQVTVIFSKETISVDNIDSVKIRLQNATAPENRNQHLVKLTGLYATQMGCLAAAKYLLTVSIHTKKNEQGGYRIL